MADKANKHMDEFVFRYSLNKDEIKQHDPIYENPLIELFLQQLINLLDILDFTYQGKEVSVDGFRFINNPQQNFYLFSKEQKGTKET